MKPRNLENPQRNFLRAQCGVEEPGEPPEKPGEPPKEEPGEPPEEPPQWAAAKRRSSPASLPAV